MAFLEQFSEEERELLVSLPYRVGVFVSSVDDSGGSKADFEELRELENIIAEKGRGMFESAFVHEIMSETCTRQADWKRWGENVGEVLADCEKAVGIISGKLMEKDLDAYRMNIMSIGLSVAKAFRELDIGEPFFARLQTQMQLFTEALTRLITRDKSYDRQAELNISYEEDVALSKLSKALHPGT